MMQPQQFSPKQKIQGVFKAFSTKSFFSRNFQAPLKSKIKFQGFSSTSRSSTNPGTVSILKWPTVVTVLQKPEQSVLSWKPIWTASANQDARTAIGSDNENGKQLRFSQVATRPHGHIRLCSLVHLIRLFSGIPESNVSQLQNWNGWNDLPLYGVAYTKNTNGNFYVQVRSMN